MSRRVAIIEEFDDDTDLPLPSRPLQNTGTRGPLLEEIASSGEEDEDDDLSSEAGPASSAQQQLGGSQQTEGRPQGTVTDITPYKKWTCVYPIYIDAKRPYGTGERRVARSKSVWWPLSKDIADVTSRMGLGTLHEVNKSHPRDWENPGRVRVQWKKDGRLLNPNIRTKKQLLETISVQIQHIKPDSIPKLPYQPAPPKVSTAPPPSKSSIKSKDASSKSKAVSSASAPSKSSMSHGLPAPPEPHPPLASRVSAYSPALPTGVLVDTVKAGMSAQDGAGPALPGMPGGASGAGQKGKRKVVRVRG